MGRGSEFGDIWFCGKGGRRYRWLSESGGGGRERKFEMILSLDV